MNYQVLARKWRPHNFHEMVGQTHVLRALINALDTGRLHHAYLFTGTRGVGKTTISRILTKCLNCEQGVSSTPCGICTTCREIDEGRFIDLIEVDGASRTKVEDTRELLENIQYAPTKGRFKVYLIDEVHMLSSHSFNALLKTLEEPPPHVKFLLATTDPQKLPVTILSRCLQFALKNIPAERIVEHLAHVLETEKIPFEREALWLLGRAAQGSMRDAMSLSDQAIAFGGEKVNTADVSDMLGTLDQKQVYQLLLTLLEGDAKALLVIINQLAEQSPDWLDVLGELLSILHRVAIAQAFPDAIDNSLGDKEQILGLAKVLPAEDVQFYYQVGLLGRRDLPLAPDGQQGFEMVLLRMLAFRPAEANQVPVKNLKEIASKVLAEKKILEKDIKLDIVEQNLQQVETNLQPAVIDAKRDNLTINEGVNSCSTAHQDQQLIANEKLDSEMLSVKSQLSTLDQADQDQFAEDYLNPDDYQSLLQNENIEHSEEKQATNLIKPTTGLAAQWLIIFYKLKLTGITANIAANCTLIEKNDNSWHLQLDPTQQALFSDNQRKRINEAINEYIGHQITLKVTIEPPLHETPAIQEKRFKAEKQLAAEQSIHNDPLIQQLKEQFSAIIYEESIKPLK